MGHGGGMRRKVVDWERAAGAFIRWQVGMSTAENGDGCWSEHRHWTCAGWFGATKRRWQRAETLVRRDECWGGAVIRRTAVPRAQAGHSSQAAPS